MNKRSSIEHKALLYVLKKTRLQHGIRQSDLALLLNHSQSFVSKYESGEIGLDLIELRKISHALDITLKEFIDLFEKQIEEFKREEPNEG